MRKESYRLATYVRGNDPPRAGIVVDDAPLDVGALSANETNRERSVIVLLLVGGPSQLETWDPKPDAPSDIRGPFGTVGTRIPGFRFSEIFPKLAGIAERLSLAARVVH